MTYATAAEIVAEQIVWWRKRGIGPRDAWESLGVRRKSGRCRWDELQTYMIRWLMRA